MSRIALADGVGRAVEYAGDRALRAERAAEGADAVAQEARDSPADLTLTQIYRAAVLHQLAIREYLVKSLELLSPDDAVRTAIKDFEKCLLALADDYLVDSVLFQAVLRNRRRMKAAEHSAHAGVDPLDPACQS